MTSGNVLDMGVKEFIPVSAWNKIPLVHLIVELLVVLIFIRLKEKNIYLNLDTYDYPA
jgi:hypothetical protein